MEGIKQAKELGGFIDTWGKIFILLGSAIVSCAFAYYMLLNHEQRIDLMEEKHEKDVEALRADYKRQYGIMEEKSDKRFQQGMDVAFELKYRIDKHDELLRQNDKEINYQVGWREAENFYKKRYP